MRSGPILLSVSARDAFARCLLLASLLFGCGVAQAQEQPAVYRCTLLHGGFGVSLQIDRDVTAAGRLMLENARVEAEGTPASNSAFVLDSSIEYRAGAQGPAPAMLAIRTRALVSTKKKGASGARLRLRLANQGVSFTLDAAEEATFQFDWRTFEQIFEGVDMVLAELMEQPGAGDETSRTLGVAAIDLRLLRRGAAMKDGAERQVDSLMSRAASDCSSPGSEAGMIWHRSDCSEKWSGEGMTYLAMPGTVSWEGPLGGNFQMAFWSSFPSYYDFPRLGFPRDSSNGIPASVYYQDDNSVWDRRRGTPTIIREGNPLRQEIAIRTGNRLATGWTSVPIPLDWVKDTGMPANAELTVRTRARGEIARFTLPRARMLRAEAELQAGYQRMLDNALAPAGRCRWTQEVIGGPSNDILVTGAQPVR